MGKANTQNWYYFYWKIIEKIWKSKTFLHNEKKGDQAQDVKEDMLYDSNNNQNSSYLSVNFIPSEPGEHG